MWPRRMLHPAGDLMADREQDRDHQQGFSGAASQREERNVLKQLLALLRDEDVPARLNHAGTDKLLRRGQSVQIERVIEVSEPLVMGIMRHASLPIGAFADQPAVGETGFAAEAAGIFVIDFESLLALRRTPQ